MRINNKQFKQLDYIEIIRDRKKRLKKIRKDRSALVGHIIYYTENPVDFINDWMWTYDPRKKVSSIPFILFEKQMEFVDWIINLHKIKSDGLAEKSRDMGASWLCMAVSIWMWIFKGGSKVGFGSRKEQLVDKLGDMDSLFEKGRYILRNMPKEFLPNGYVESKHATHMKFINPENGSSITGECGDNIGRGGRSSIYFLDEAAFIERPEKIESSLSQNTDVQIPLSTPNGNGNPFYQKRVGGKMPVFTFHWRDHPHKTQEWYDRQKEKLDPVILAQEIDIDYTASVSNICIPNKWVRAAVGLDIPAEGTKMAGLDVADEGADKNSLAIGKGVVVNKITAWGYGNTTQTARKAFAECKAEGIEILRYDSIGVGAGIKGEMSVIEKGTMQVIGVGVGEAPTEYDLEEDKSNKDMFLNLKAELWWSLRRRFEKTYEHVKGIKVWKTDDMISIPNDSELIAELSQPKYEFAENGKIKIESKKNMKKRGIKSPNKADALCLYFANIRATVIVEEEFGSNDIDYLYDDDERD